MAGKEWADQSRGEKVRTTLYLIVIAVCVWYIAGAACSDDQSDASAEYPEIQGDRFVTEGVTMRIRDEDMPRHQRVYDAAMDHLIYDMDCRGRMCYVDVYERAWNDMPHDRRHQALITVLMLEHLEDEDITLMDVRTHTDRDRLASLSLETGRMY